jgi:hypothetical protein
MVAGLDRDKLADRRRRNYAMLPRDRAGRPKTKVDLPATAPKD